MTDSGRRNYWRIARWSLALVLLLIPIVMNQISDEWRWELRGFILVGVVIGGVGLLYELAERASGNWGYRAGMAIVLVTPVLTMWTTIVRDDGDGVGFIMLVLAAIAGAFTAWFRPAGMARAALGLAVMQALLGLLIVTAPSTASQPDGGSRAVAFCSVFTILWLAAAALFYVAAKDSDKRI